MNLSIPYRLLCIAFGLIGLYGCSRKDTRLTLWRNDKIPYGTYYAYQQLNHIFGDAEIKTSSRSPVNFYNDEGNAAAFIVIGHSFIPSENEFRALLNYASSGNQVFISALDIRDNVLDSFRLKTANDRNSKPKENLSLTAIDLQTFDSLAFSYPGAALDDHFTALDSNITTILGKDASGKANFVRFSYTGGGSVFLHLAPTAFTNYFLLHKQNKEYYDRVFSAMPDSITSIVWDDYYRHHTDGKDNNQKSGFSKLGVFWKDPILRWALALSLLLFAFIFLFETKRKQRAVPAVKPLNNTSLDFVKTIGRLYFQRKDNKNLASKMAAHLLGHIRTRYQLTTSQLDDAFEKKLAYKSGYPEEAIKNIMTYVHSIDTKNAITDDELLAFNEKLEKFYKQT